ncbi:MAG: hypothetical protein GY941_29485 [Planctomycetes bacterium]|nr:hypothetical protein [Planctomycetota bacterium]
MDIIVYISLFMIFSGACAGLFGDTWNKSKKQLIKLTIIGWISVSIFTLGFIFSVFGTYTSQKKRDLDKIQRQYVKEIAYTEIATICHYLAAPFCTMYFYEEEKGDWNWLSKPDSVLSIIGIKARDAFDGANIAKKVATDTGYDELNISYIEYIDAIYSSKPLELYDTMHEWILYLEPEDILLINQLYKHEYLSTLENLKPYEDTTDSREEWNKLVGVFHYEFENYEWYTDFNDNYTAHNDFFRKLHKLWSKVYTSLNKEKPKVES